MGGMFRLSRRGWVRFLQDRAAGGDLSLEDVGGRVIGVLASDVTDLTEVQAAELLEQALGK